MRAIARTADRAIEVEDISVALVEFKNGCVATVINSILSPREETYLRIDLQQATVELRHLYGYDNSSWRFTPAPGAAADAQAALVATPTNPGPQVVNPVAAAGYAALCALPTPDVPANHTTQIGAILTDVAAGTLPLTAGDQARRTIELLTVWAAHAQGYTAYERPASDAERPQAIRVGVAPAVIIVIAIAGAVIAVSVTGIAWAVVHYKEAQVLSDEIALIEQNPALADAIAKVNQSAPSSSPADDAASMGGGWGWLLAALGIAGAAAFILPKLGK